MITKKDKAFIDLIKKLNVIIKQEYQHDEKDVESLGLYLEYHFRGTNIIHISKDFTKSNKLEIFDIHTVSKYIREEFLKRRDKAEYNNYFAYYYNTMYNYPLSKKEKFIHFIDMVLLCIIVILGILYISFSFSLFF